MTETDTEAEDCPRCGSLLPEEEEGLCPTCGYEFGRATLYMPVVRLDGKEDASAADIDLLSGPMALPPAPTPEVTGSDPGKWIVIAVVVVTLLVVIVVASGLTLWVYGRSSVASADPPNPVTTQEVGLEGGE